MEGDLTDQFWFERREAANKVKDDRTPYERDYARVVHSAAFRRLQAKTQVLGVGDSDFYRTRLTHSLEVGQIGVAITKKLYRDAKKEEIKRILPPPMLMATICLAHDLGHPPFGHGGEVALNRCMLPYGGFEGNGQTLRIVTCLEPYHPHLGMNLTLRATLGLIKYPAPYKDVVNWSFYGETSEPQEYIETKDQKFLIKSDTPPLFVAKNFKPPKCYLNDEHQIIINWISQKFEDWDHFCKHLEQENEHKKTIYKTLDTSIMEIADDIAYGVHDLEDAIGLKLISKQQLKDYLDEHHDKISAKRNVIISEYLKKNSTLSFDQFIENLFDKGTCVRKNTIGDMVGHFIQAVEIKEKNFIFKNDLMKYQATLGNNYLDTLHILKKAVVDLVIKSTPVQQLEFKGQKIVTELFNAFATDPQRLLNPRDYQNTIQGGGAIPTPRVICDHIAGMTDDYARKRYEQLFRPRSGSVFDKL